MHVIAWIVDAYRKWDVPVDGNVGDVGASKLFNYTKYLYACPCLVEM